jgi:tRNA-specific 2-thiouridylase
MENGFGVGIAPGTRVLVAMSGGVDSSVAAYRLVKAGMDVVGVTMHLVSQMNKPIAGAQASDDRACCSLAAAEDARRVAAKLQIPHYVLNLAGLFEERVVEPSRAEYARGRTPNPCILCNRHMKFDVLFMRAGQLGCTHVATGHYAGIAHDSDGWHLLKGIDPVKDQSYFLAFLTEKELPRIVFPVGTETKEAVKSEARRIGLKVADRPESQDLCFFAKGREPVKADDPFHSPHNPGEFVLTDGTVVGIHEGISRYTVGQRRGLPGGMHEPLYVIEIDPETNRVVVGIEAECFRPRFEVEDVSFVSENRDRGRLEGEVDIRVRYRTEPVTGMVTLTGGRAGRVELAKPVRAITPGQAAVFYDANEVLGAGTISKVLK